MIKKCIDYIYSLSIYTKLAFLIYSVVTFVATSSMIATNYSANAQNKKVFYEVIDSVINANENIILEFLLTDNSWQLYKFLKNLSDHTSLIQEIGFIDAKNSIIAHTNTKKYPIGIQYKKNISDKSLYFIDFKREKISFGYFVVKIQPKSFLENLEDILFTNMLMVIFAGIFSVILSYIFIRKLLGRIELLLTNTRAIANKNWEVITTCKSRENDEITEIINTTEKLMLDIKQHIQTTEKQKNFYHHLLESIDTLILICDKQLQLSYQNSHPLSDCILSTDKKNIDKTILANIISNLNENNKSFLIPLDCLVTAKNEEHSIFVNLHTIDENIILSFVDATQIKKDSDKEKVLNSLKVLGEISSLFAHEIKNLIQPLRLLLPKGEIPDVEDIDIVNLTIDKIDKQISNYFSLRKPIQENSKESLKILPIVQNIQSLYQRLLDEKQLTLNVNIPNDTEIFIPMQSLELIIINLLKNAIEASIPRHSILIEWKEHDEKSGYLCFENSCKTLSKSIKENLFKPFFTTKKEGSGMGLFGVYRIVYLLGGAIQVRHKLNAIRFELTLQSKANI